MSGDVHGLTPLKLSGGKLIEPSVRSPADGEENKLHTTPSEVHGKSTLRNNDEDVGSVCAEQRTLSKSINVSKGSKCKTVEFQKDLKEGGYETLSPRFRCSSHEMDDRREEYVSLSADVTPPFSRSGTPSYLKWAEGLQYLLQDLEGVNLFKIYLTQDKCAESLDFWFACEGLKKASATDVNYIQQVIKLIYKKFIRSRLIEIKPETRDEIASKIESKMGLDQTIFDDAQKNIEDIMTRTTYPNFLKSEVYLHHVQFMQQNVHLGSPKQAEGSESVSENSSSNNSRQGLDILPTLHEDAEMNDNPGKEAIPFTREVLKQRSRIMGNVLHYRPEVQAGHYLHGPSRVPKPYHMKYSTVIPTSVQDSELQSLSSDAQTDDTMSLTDSSSVDCGPTLPSRSQLKRHQQAMKKNASLNRDYLAHQTIIPRTQRPPKEFIKPMQEEDFAALLTQKLLQVKKEREAQEKIEESIRKLEIEEEKTHSCDNAFQSSVGRFAGIPSQLLTAAIKEKQAVTEENDQSILDQHVSRVWNDSAHQTPGQLSSSPIPLSPPLERRRSSVPGSSGFIPLMSMRLSTPGLSSGGLYVSPYQSLHTHHRPRRDRDACSSDSGTVHDFTPENEPTNFPAFPLHIHKHVHHHHPTMSRTSPEQFTTAPVEHQQTRRTKDTSRRSSNKKLSTNDSSSSCIDSGVSVACDPIPPTVASSERVYHWMMDNEKYTSHGHGPDSEKDSSTKHKKSNRSSLSTTSPIPCRQSNSKKLPAYNIPRSSSVERGGPLPLHLQSSISYSKSSNPHVPTYPFPCGVQPTQPIALDPSMPILPPPDTATQLLEAKRRLEDEARLKSGKTKTNSSRDKQGHQDSGRGKFPVKNFDITEDSAIPSSRKSSKKTSPPTHHPGSLPTTPSDVTVIGYCFSGESVPYRTKLLGKNITLKQFKTLLSKKGNYRYFFKKECNEFGTGVVNEEISDDSEVLPLWEGKIFGTIKSVD
ncbi:axin-1-like isoform X2 [Limulus polyphemus]|uniref:Axin-1-like isoform X2 n=1 Tax=Limulus polyphemus TaxID=6850 RepID=A0ABM1BBB7_LIMPO|nr:axin-1-like isoform X2 [Limulus polyphemus]